MTKTQEMHTPTPWQANQSELAASSPLCSIRGPNGAYQVCSDTNAANAAFIVRAVNSHAALVEALELISEHDEFTHPKDAPLHIKQAYAILNQLRVKARAALTLAKGA